MPWSGPELGGEVVVEHRVALDMSLFISGNPGRLGKGRMDVAGVTWTVYHRSWTSQPARIPHLNQEAP